MANRVTWLPLSEDSIDVGTVPLTYREVEYDNAIVIQGDGEQIALDGTPQAVRLLAFAILAEAGLSLRDIVRAVTEAWESDEPGDPHPAWVDEGGLDDDVTNFIERLASRIEDGKEDRS